jgi:hypothetical protein
VSFNCATIRFFQRPWRFCKHSRKPFCESLFSSSVAFLIMSVTLKMRRPFKGDFGLGNRWKSASARLRDYGGCCSLVTFFFVKINLTITNRCPGVLRRTNQTLVLQYSRRFLLTASLKPWLMLNHSKHYCKLFQQIPWTSYRYYNI